MKILFCCQSYPPAGGGVARVMQELAERLAGRGHDVTVVTTKISSRQLTFLNNVTIKEFAVSGNMVDGLIGEVDLYREFVIGSEYDVMLVYAAQQWSFDALLPVLSQIRARKLHVPCGYSSFYDPKYKTYYQQMPSILAQFDCLIYNSGNYRDILFAMQHGIENYVVIPNGANEMEFAHPPLMEFRRQMAIQKDEFIFLTVGSPPSLKGHREVVLAYAQLELPFSSVLILDGRYDLAENPLEQSIPIVLRRMLIWAAKWILRKPLFPMSGFRRAFNAINRQKGKRVVITNLSREDIIAAFFASDLFVFASHVEYSPLVLFESVAAGLPFLTVPVGNSEEIIQWTGGGVLCPAERNNRGYTFVSPDVLASEMQKMAIDETQRAQLRTQGRKNWSNNFTWAAIAVQYENVMLNRALTL